LVYITTVPIMYTMFCSEDIGRQSREEKRQFWTPDLYGEVIPQISDIHFKSHSLPSMSSGLVEFHSASSESS